MIVSGSYFDQQLNMIWPTYSSEALLLEPVRTVCSLGKTVSIPSTSLESETVYFSATETQAISILMIVIPVALIVACLVVFLRRRHL